MNTKFEDISKKIQGHIAEGLKHVPEGLKHVPEGWKNVQSDIEKNIHSTLQNAFAKLDLVTREEFDAQSQVLARTRVKLEQLEKQLEVLQAKTNKA